MRNGATPVITGIGIVTGLGIGTETNWEKMVQGESGIRRIQRFDPSRLPTQIGSELTDDFDEAVKKRVRKITRNRTADFTQLALLGTSLALEDSGLDLKEEDRERVGVILGNCMGGIGYLEKRFRDFSEEMSGKSVSLEESIMTQVIIDRMESLFGLKYMQNAMSAQVAIDHKIYGPNMVISTACAAGGMAAEIAATYIQQGQGDIFITGGSEIFVTEACTMGFNKLTALSLNNDDPQGAVKPFDKNRDGTVLGDGAGIVVMESEERARKRGAKIYARVLGFANICEGYSLATPEPSGKHMGMVMDKALKNAGVNPEQIDYVSAHGTGTFHNDKAETAGIKLVYKDHAKKLLISSLKSMIGHTIGAAGGLELAVTALSLSRGVVTPTINYETPDPDCDLYYVPNEAQEKDIRMAASNSFALGGHNSCIILEKG